MRCSSPVCSITSTVSVRSYAERGSRFLPPQNTIESINTFTYRHSERPPMTDEIKAQIAKIDFNVANLILKNHGNYRALSELAETLSDCLDSCEMNLHWWQLDRVREHSKHSVDLPELSHRASEAQRTDLHCCRDGTARILCRSRLRRRRS